MLHNIKYAINRLFTIVCRFLQQLQLWFTNSSKDQNPKTVPVSVNYHFTRQCNYQCGFCFHTAKTSYVLPLDEAKKGLKMLADAGMEKINFSGGEPFIHKKGKYLGELVRFCKQELALKSVSIISNGSLVTEEWIERYGADLDILAISCDSFNEETNRKIGRWAPGKDHIEQLYRVRNWCEDYNVLFKINTTVCVHNWEEDMNEQIKELQPVRWKVFQCLLIDGENCGESALRHAEQMVISDEQFEAFLRRHKDISQRVPENNEKMRNSYLILDEYMRFLNNVDGAKVPGKSILDVGVANALDYAGFDEDMFLKRGGKYKWSKGDNKLEW